MKYLRLFENFEDIYSMCKRYKINRYTVNDDGSIDVDGSVNLVGKLDGDIPFNFRYVSGDFYCMASKLTSVVGSPKRVDGDFYCSRNKITSLIGGPESVGGDFYCNNNDIMSFEGFPKSIGDDFDCYGTPIYQIWLLFEDYSKIELFNDYDIIRNVDELCKTSTPEIVLDRLNSFLEDIGKPTVKKVNGYNNI